MGQDSLSLEQILQQCSQQQTTTTKQLQQLINLELADLSRSRAFDLDDHNCWQKLEQRSQLFCQLSPEIVKFCQAKGWEKSSTILVSLWQLWLPLAMELAAARQNQNCAVIQGILGGQGTGKSTLAEILQLILRHLGYGVANFSLDDLYLTYEERKQLQQTDPRLIWRGPPGTHDVNLGLRVLERCLAEDCTEPILIPRFDKSAFNGSGDRIQPVAIERADIVLFEGWFVGVQPVADKIWENPPVPITTPEEILFAQDNNQRLKAYLPLWSKLDRLLVLYPVDYRLSKQWRKEAEHQMMAQGKSGMNDTQIDRFVDYFWHSLHPELFITPLVKNRDRTNLVIEINADHSYGKIYRPD